MDKTLNQLYDVEDDEDEDTMGDFLKENYNLSDFLKYGETRKILKLLHRQQFDTQCVELLETFYKSEVNFCKNNLSTLFCNETELPGANLGCFLETIYSNIHPEYDLSVFYDDPSLARNMVESYDERLKNQEISRLRKIRHNLESQGNALKTYDWKNKKYK